MLIGCLGTVTRYTVPSYEECVPHLVLNDFQQSLWWSLLALQVPEDEDPGVDGRVLAC